MLVDRRGNTKHGCNGHHDVVVIALQDCTTGAVFGMTGVFVTELMNRQGQLRRCDCGQKQPQESQFVSSAGPFGFLHSRSFTRNRMSSLFEHEARCLFFLSIADGAGFLLRQNNSDICTKRVSARIELALRRRQLGNGYASGYRRKLFVALTDNGTTYPVRQTSSQSASLHRSIAPCREPC